MKGVKGESWLSCLGSLDVVDGMSCDYMHGVLLGVVKLLLSLWTEVSRCSGLPCDIRQYLLQIDSCIDQIEVPSEISRLPRGIQDHLKNWKGTSTITITSMCCFTGEALVTPCSPPRLNSTGIPNLYALVCTPTLASEYRSWLLYYSVPVLRHILENYFQHYLLLVEAVWLLLQSSISEADLLHAEQLLQHFCYKFSAYYGS